MFKLELSVSTKTPTSKEHGKFITTFNVRQDISVDQKTLTELFNNYIYSTNQWKNGQCLNDNFINMTGITIDIDEKVPMDEAKKLFASYNYIIHTSTSHKENLPKKNGVQDRYRVILPFDPSFYGKINKKEQAEAVYEKIMEKYPFVDQSCADPARKYFPFLNIKFPNLFELHINDVGNYFSVDIDEIEKKIVAEKVVSVTGKEGVDVDDIYRLKLDDLFLLKDKKTWKRLRDFDPNLPPSLRKVPVFCNACDDINSQGHSAFVNFTHNNLPFVHCTHCQKTYFLNLLESFPELFYLGNTMWKVNERGEISIDKCPVPYLHDLNPDVRKRLERELAHHRGFATSTFRLQRLVDGYSEKRRWRLDDQEAQLYVYSPPVAVKVKDNDFVNNYFKQAFTDQYHKFIKLWVAIFCHENFRTLPVLVLNGERGTGKSTFGEMLQNIYPSLVAEWKAEHSDFTEYLEKKLLLVDEAEVDRKEQYTLIKSLTGSDMVSVNIKFMPKYRVKNNVNIIMTTNNDSPLYLTHKEKPRGEFDNQFFMYTFPDLAREMNSNIKVDLADRLGWWVRTDGRELYEAWKADPNKHKYRYGIPAPITPLLLQQFRDARSAPDYAADEVYYACIEGLEVKDRQGNLTQKLGPYDVINSSELMMLIDALPLKTTNIKSIRERMQANGYLSKDGDIQKDNRDAWQVIPRDKLKKRNPNGTTNSGNGASGNSYYS